MPFKFVWYVSCGLVRQRKRIPLAPMGVLAPMSAHAGPSAQPALAEISAESISTNFPIFLS